MKGGTLAEGQSPYTVIVTCSDSRVVPEVIFDEGLGDLFVIRFAGNIIGSTEFESVIYAVDHLNPSIIVVMGYENCGAVNAVVQSHDQDIPAIARFIKPSVKKAKSMQTSDLLRHSVEFNALNMRAETRSPMFRGSCFIETANASSPQANTECPSANIFFAALISAFSASDHHLALI